MNQDSQTQLDILEADYVSHQQKRMNQDTASWEENRLYYCLMHQYQTINDVTKEQTRLQYATLISQENTVLVHI